MIRNLVPLALTHVHVVDLTLYIPLHAFQIHLHPPGSTFQVDSGPGIFSDVIRPFNVIPD